MPFNRAKITHRPFPEADLGLYHGAKPKKVWKITPPKLPGWTPSVQKVWKLPNVFKHEWHFPSLGKTYLVKTSTQAIRAIDLAGGVEPYLLHTKPDKLGVVGWKLRTLVIDALAAKKKEHLERTKAEHLLRHPPKPRRQKWIYPKPVVVWAWLQDAELHNLRRACVRCGTIGHSQSACQSTSTMLGTACTENTLHDLHSHDASTSQVQLICSEYHQLGQCGAEEPCDADKAGLCPMCGEKHPAYEHVVDGLRQNGVDIDYRPTRIESLPDFDTPAMETESPEQILEALAHEEAIARQLLRVRTLDALQYRAHQRWTTAGQPSLDGLQPTHGHDVDSTRADMESLGVGDELFDSRDVRHRYLLSDHLKRPAVTVVPI